MIKAAFIGTGNIAGSHLRYLKTRTDVAMVGLADPNRENAKKRQTEFGGDVFADYQSMLDQVKPDAVWVCPPPTVRKEPLLACAERGLPVFCEKPVERQVKVGEAITRELIRRQAHVQVGYVFRSMPVIAQLREAMRDDHIHLIQSYYGCGISLTMTQPPWFYDKAKSGGALVDQATHNFDLLRNLFGEVKEIRGMANNPVRPKNGNYTIDETLGVMFLFVNGMIASHLHTWVGDSWRNEIALSGEKRFYRLLPARGQLIVEDRNTRSAHDPLDEKTGAGNPATPFRFEQERRSIYEYENEQYLRQVVSGDWSQNPCSYEDGLKTLSLTMACDRAIRCGRATLA